MRRALRVALKTLAAVVFLLWSLAPVLFIVVSSFKSGLEIFAYPPRLLFTPTLENYVSLWHNWPAFFTTMGNSLIVAGGATVLAAAVSFLAGYGYSRFRGRLLALSVLYMIAIRLLPPIVVTLPLFPVVDLLGLSDTHAVLILLYAAFWVSLFTMIMKTAMDEVPMELDEAATVDGAGPLRTLWHVILPLAVQGTLAGALFVFVFAWNEYLFALIFTTDNAKTAPLIISEVMDAIYGTDWGVLFAGVTVQILPVVLLVGLAQRLLVSGLTAGSVKG